MAKTYLLTKSKYIRGLQCERALYYDVYSPKLARYSPETLALFRGGREFEATYKAVYPMGIAMDKVLGYKMDKYPQATADLLAQEGEVVLFEAGFLYNDVLVLADVVRKAADGTIDIFEVKNNSEVKDVFRRDAAVQHYVISHCVERIGSFNIVGNGGDGQFVVTDILDYCCQQSAEIEANIERFKSMLQGEEPTMAIGGHCESPYPCPYKWYCQRKRKTI